MAIETGGNSQSLRIFLKRSGARAGYLSPV
jgi:hypothetical protein